MNEETQTAAPEAELPPRGTPAPGRKNRSRPKAARHQPPAPQQSAAPTVSAPPPGRRLHRSRRRTEDKFYIDKKLIPPGMDYNWKRESVFGAPDPQHLNSLRDNHWAEVPEGRHPGLLTRVDGMVLMERPLYLSQEAQVEDFEIARDQLARVQPENLRRQAPPGTLTRDHASVRAAERHNVEHVVTEITPPKS